MPGRGRPQPTQPAVRLAPQEVQDLKSTGFILATVLLLAPGGCAYWPRPSAPAPTAPIGWIEPAAYAFAMDARCGERTLIGRFRVIVRNGAAVRVDGLDDQGRAIAPFLESESVPSLGQMLRRVAEARRDPEAGEVVLRSDPLDGHPTQVSIDWRLNAIDDEECYEISDYVVDPH